jgi:hypothetical protein
MKTEVNKTDRGSPCPAGAVTDNLFIATNILFSEGLVKQPFGREDAISCDNLKKKWEEYCVAQVDGLAEDAKKFKVLSAFKGCKRIFDEPCMKCDKRNSEKAKKEWREKILLSPQETKKGVLSFIKWRTRWIMSGWKYQRPTFPRVPDQQGCCELERGCGGTLGVAKAEDNPVQLNPLAKVVRESEDVRACRIGTAKAKGKVRVVTMQGAKAKECLRPVHESAYDFLSRRYSWLVRGDVTPDDFLSVVNDLKEGEELVSGDYSASTDNLNLDAVQAVVGELAKFLPDEEAGVLVESFRPWVGDEGGEKNVVRGSMMGNLLSFVVLCLLNRITMDLAIWEVDGAEALYKNDRIAKINGDDIMFPASDAMYKAWLKATSEVGFVINESKTMRSRKFVELNSQVYDVRRRALIPKLNFGFLQSSERRPAGSLATPIFELMARVKYATACKFIFSHWVQKEFSRCAPALTEVPKNWWKKLVKRKWFRRCIQYASAEELHTGTDRKIDFVRGPILVDDKWVEAVVRVLEGREVKKFVKEWRGVQTCPAQNNYMPKRLYNLPVVAGMRRGAPVPNRMWIRPVLELVRDRCPQWINEEPSRSEAVKAGAEWTRPLISWGVQHPPILPEHAIPTRNLLDGSLFFAL